MRRLLPVLAAFLLSGPAIAQQVPAKAQSVAEPAGAWSVDYGDWQCTLKRQFLTDGQPTAMALTLEPLDKMAWLRFADHARITKFDSGEAVLFADGQRDKHPVHFNARPGKDARVREYWLDLDRDGVAGWKSNLRLWTRSQGDTELHLGNFAAAWAALGQCMTGLYADFGIDAAQVQQLAKRPEGNIFDAARLPELGAESMEFAALYWVDASGHVDDCRLLMPSRREKFDQSFCADLKAKGRFAPARDATGKAVRAPVFEHPVIRTVTTVSVTPM